VFLDKPELPEAGVEGTNLTFNEWHPHRMKTGPGKERAQLFRASSSGTLAQLPKSKILWGFWVLINRGQALVPTSRLAIKKGAK
jgi:hypothetical protein